MQMKRNITRSIIERLQDILNPPLYFRITEYCHTLRPCPVDNQSNYSSKQGEFIEKRGGEVVF